MHRVRLSSILSLVVTACLSTIVSAQEAGRIESMKLLTSDVGWAATSHRLFWTTTAGGEWRDITPQAKANRVIASVFFLNTSSGRVLLAYGGKEDPKTGISETLFELASTSDSGASWSVQRLDVPDSDPGRGLSGEAWIDFVDSLHGWLMVRMNGNPAMNIGVLQATEDGGRTWKRLGAPAAGRIHFMTIKEGWLDGGPNAEEDSGIYVTRDGGVNWARLTVKVPADVLPKIYPVYQLPQFVDKDKGFLLVTFSEPNDESPKLAFFETSNGGRTWDFGGALPEGRTVWPMTIAGSDWLAAGCPGDKPAIIRAVGSRMLKTVILPTIANDICAGGGFLALSFADSNRGWILPFGGALLSTPDGGIAWTEITPPAAKATNPANKSEAT